jgi:hypothetical protein
MRRESPVRICERLGVKFPGPTRPSAVARAISKRYIPSVRLEAIVFATWFDLDIVVLLPWRPRFLVRVDPSAANESVTWIATS